MISAEYKHLPYFPLRLIDDPTPEVRENLSCSCHDFKIQEVLLFFIARAPGVVTKHPMSV